MPTTPAQIPTASSATARVLVSPFISTPLRVASIVGYTFH